MFLTKKHLSRRTVLRGMGASIALPLLDAMIPAGTALANTAARPAPRLGFIYFPHGAVMDRWTPKGTGTDFELPQILKPLEPYRSHLTVVSGLRNKGAESPDPHGIIAGTWLSCVSPRDREGDRGVTVDQLAARQIGQDTPLPSLEISGESGVATCSGVDGCGFGNSISFRTPRQSLPMENNPRKVFYQIFGQGDTPEERAAILHETGSILDYVLDRAASLKKRLGPADRARMDEYLDSVREVERRIEKLAASGTSDVDVTAPMGVPDQFDEQLNVMFEMIALAWQTNMTRIASFMMAREVSMRTYNNIGVPDAFHPLSHHQDDPAKLDRLSRIQTYHTQVFSRFVKRLAEMPDGDGSMLDHSIILFGSNMSNSDLHNNDPLPSAILGRGYGRIKGNQHLHYPQDTPLANLMVTLLDRAGVTVESFADATGPFAEV
ncbi:MAG: hypothetical protein DIU71_01560 [Proteobacteria bacterium]|nr:MAG: hypothetical protein DIU71_01560 [Pseudomonadota bacterium]